MTSPVAQKPLVTPTPFPTSPLMEVPELSERKTATTPTALNSLLKREGFSAVNLKQENLDRGPKRLVVDVKIKSSECFVNGRGLSPSFLRNL